MNASGDSPVPSEPPAAAPGLLELSLRTFLDRAGERRPTPGGGSVAALAAALAVSMARMVVAYSRGRKAVAAHRGTLDALESALATLDDRTRALIDADAAAYQAYREAVRDAGNATAPAVHAALVRAAEVPLAIAERSAELLETLASHARLLNPRLRSDLLVACHLARAAARAAGENVAVNAGGLPEADAARRLLDASAGQVRRVDRAAAAIEAGPGDE